MEQLLDRVIGGIAGLMDLGMAEEAARVLDALPCGLPTHPEVGGAVQVDVCLAAGHWEEAVSV